MQGTTSDEVVDMDRQDPGEEPEVVVAHVVVVDGAAGPLRYLPGLRGHWAHGPQVLLPHARTSRGQATHPGRDVPQVQPMI